MFILLFLLFVIICALAFSKSGGSGGFDGKLNKFMHQIREILINYYNESNSEKALKYYKCTNIKELAEAINDKINEKKTLHCFMLEKNNFKHPFIKNSQPNYEIISKKLLDWCNIDFYDGKIERNENKIMPIQSVGKLLTIYLLFKYNITEISETIELPTAQTNRLKEVTLEQIINHKAGFGDYFKKLKEDYNLTENNLEGESIELKDFIKYTDDLSEIGTYKYSNDGYVILGLMLEKKTGMKYNDLLLSVFKNEDIRFSKISSSAGGQLMNIKTFYNVFQKLNNAKFREYCKNFYFYTDGKIEHGGALGIYHSRAMISEKYSYVMLGLNTNVQIFRIVLDYF